MTAWDRQSGWNAFEVLALCVLVILGSAMNRCGATERTNLRDRLNDLAVYTDCMHGYI